LRIGPQAALNKAARIQVIQQKNHHAHYDEFLKISHGTTE
jgi:hypothetical protein